MIDRRVRGILGTALVWAGLAVPLAILQALFLAALGKPLPPLSYLPVALAAILVRGAFSGAVFATLLSLRARGRSLGALRLTDVARWGALGTLVFPAIAIALILVMRSAPIPPVLLLATVAQTAVLGAGCGVFTLHLARRESPAARPLAGDQSALLS